MLELRLCVPSEILLFLWLQCFGIVVRRYYGGLSSGGQVASSRIGVKVLFGGEKVFFFITINNNAEYFNICNSSL
jgi:hypothetical protein